MSFPAASAASAEPVGPAAPAEPTARALLLEGAAEVVTMAGGLRMGEAAQGDPAIAPAGTALAILDDRIVAIAPAAEAREALESACSGAVESIDCTGLTLTPGLVDAHTHLVFAGSREREVELRRRGATYLEILAAGGGILSTVAATRAASDEELLAHGRRWLASMARFGTTTVEAKSGYGLDVANELRLVSIAGRLAAEGPVDVIPTFIGAHAVPREIREAHPGDMPGATEAYTQLVIEEQLPAIAAQGIARSCDVFCEAGVFSADQSRRILLAARALGLAVRLHADELAPSGGAELAAELGALSADHLGTPSPEGITALADAARAGRPVVATLLPTVGWFLGLTLREPARELIAAGIPVALATDFNPGTSPVCSLPIAMSHAVLGLGLSASEALAATTVNAAAALGLADRGMLAPGLRADVVAWNVPTHGQLPYWVGADLARVVIAGGRRII